MLAVAQWIGKDRDLVAGIGFGLPPLAHQFNRGTHFNAPFDGFRVGIVWVRHEHLNPAVPDQSTGIPSPCRRSVTCFV